MRQCASPAMGSSILPVYPTCRWRMLSLSVQALETWGFGLGMFWVNEVQPQITPWHSLGFPASCKRCRHASKHLQGARHKVSTHGFFGRSVFCRGRYEAAQDCTVCTITSGTLLRWGLLFAFGSFAEAQARKQGGSRDRLASRIVNLFAAHNNFAWRF